MIGDEDVDGDDDDGGDEDVDGNDEDDGGDDEDDGPHRGLSPVPDEEVRQFYGGTYHVPLQQDSGFYGKVLFFLPLCRCVSDCTMTS